jgi:hypothetical protein
MGVEVSPELLCLLLVISAVTCGEAVLRLPSNEVHRIVFKVEFGEQAVDVELRELEGALVVGLFLDPDCFSFRGIDSLVTDELADVANWERSNLFYTENGDSTGEVSHLI